MRSMFWNKSRLKFGLAGLMMFGTAAPNLHAGQPYAACDTPACTANACDAYLPGRVRMAPTPAPSPSDTAPMPPDMDAPPAPMDQALEAPPSMTFDPGQSLAGFGESFAATNAIGDFVGTPFTIDLFTPGADGSFNTGDEELVDQALPFATRTFKVAEGHNPRPQNRVFGSISRFSDVGDINDNTLYRYLVGVEHVFGCGRSSLTVQMPYFSVDPGTVTANDSGQLVEFSQFGIDDDTQSDIGDLTLVWKHALYYDECSLDTCSVGLAYTAPTGPDTIADVDTNFEVDFDNDGSVQPFVGFIRGSGNGWFGYGFSAIDIPIDQDDTTLWFNDLGVGYYLAQPCGSWITAIVPKAEVHVISPINNRTQNFRIIDDPTDNVTLSADVNGDGSGGALLDGVFEIHNQVNLTIGFTLEMNRSSTLTFGYVRPLAGPEPFDHEIQIQFQCFGGGSGRGPMGLGIF